MTPEISVLTKKIDNLNLVIFIVRTSGCDKLLKTNPQVDHVKATPFLQAIDHAYLSDENFKLSSISIITCPLDHKFKSGITPFDYTIL